MWKIKRSKGKRMKCSECGGQVINVQHAVYRTDGSSNGYHFCQGCNKSKEWFIKGPGEPVIDMS